jgi:hypothetical protein
MTVIGIIGSRKRNDEKDKEVLISKLKELVPLYGGTENVIFCSGHCKKGGDKFAEEIALEIYGEDFFNKMIIHKPDESELNETLLKINPRAAYAEINYKRNTLIAKDSDILIALVSIGRRGGAEDTIKKFKKFNPKSWKSKLFLL